MIFRTGARELNGGIARSVALYLAPGFTYSPVVEAIGFLVPPS